MTKKDLKNKIKMLDSILYFLNSSQIMGDEAIDLANCIKYVAGLKDQMKLVMKELK